ncbi:17153_t:CDS:2, partial [Funneliformis geosporum]
MTNICDSQWDAVKYLEALENCKFGLEKATVTRRFKTQLQEINAQGTEEEKKNAIRLEDQFNPSTFVSILRLHTTATHGTSSSHGYGLRLRCWLQLPMELRLRMVMDFASAIESRKTGLVDNFWMKRHNFMKHENLKVNSTFLSCDGVQIGCIGNNIQGQKRPYEDREQPDLLNDKQSLNTKWRNNWAKGNTLLTDEDKDIFDCVQIVSRNFFTYLSSVSYNENKKLDEDTFIHRYCHQILEEIFNKTELSLVWANGESESSKERRLLDGHNHGRKPDFRILSKIDDTIFGEIKPPHCSNTINKSIIKLAEFMKGSLDFIINIYGYVAGLETYELKPIGSEIKIFSIDLVYDGLYRCNLLSKVLFPTESANFLNIITVVSTLYSLLERARSTINIINSSQLITESSSPRHSYCRNSNSSPKKIRVPI